MKLIALSIISLSLIHCIYSDTSEICPKPDETCMHYQECPQKIQDQVTLRPKSDELLKRLKDARCGKTKLRKMCCKTPECYTWDGRPGVCVDVSNSDKSMSKRQMKFSRCTKRKGKFLCHSNLPVRQMIRDCDSDMSAFPPDPSYDCCGKDKTSLDKIIGGLWMTIDQYPWLVVIKYEGDKKNCSGALISRKYVLTAAHCVDYSSLKPYAVVLGEHDKSTTYDCDPNDDCHNNTEQTINIEEIKVHREFNPTNPSGRNDIALIRLADEAIYSDFVQPICLPIGTSDITTKNTPPNFKMWSAGWGDINASYPSPSDVRRKVQLPFVDPWKCAQSVPHLWSRQICAGGEANKDSCSGDSGSPLMYERNGTFEVLGITSHGITRCGTSGVPAIYTKVHSYVSWIHSNIRP